MWLLNKNLVEYFKEIMVEQLKASKDSDPSDFPPISQTKKKILIKCPICKKSTEFEIPPQFLDIIITNPRGVANISIRKGLICPHHFMMVMDKNGDIRGYEKIDIDLEDL